MSVGTLECLNEVGWRVRLGNPSIVHSRLSTKSDPHRIRVVMAVGDEEDPLARTVQRWEQDKQAFITLSTETVLNWLID